MARERSPNYPAISLAKAIADVTALYTKEGRTRAPLEVAAKAWGYKSLSGPARSRIAALRQYGLASQVKGKLSPTELALAIILRGTDSPERQQALRRAALAPDIFGQLRDQYPGASVDALRHHLIVDRRFTDDGAKRLIESYTETIAFAKLDKPSYDSLSEGESEGDKTTLEERGMQSYRLPISGTKWTTLQGNFPITSAEWEQMIAVLGAMKPALVSSEPTK